MSFDISTKVQGTKLYAEGFFGNTLRVWNTCAELREADPPPVKVVLRQRKRHGGGICVYGLTADQAVLRRNCYTAQGFSDLYFSEQIERQPENIVFQGEYVHLPEGEYLKASTAKDFHRPAMNKAQHYKGPSCRLILSQFMDSRSYENLINLAEAFPSHVIEFTTCDEPVGTLALPTIFWEVRNY